MSQIKRRRNGGKFPQKKSKRRNEFGKLEKQLSPHIFKKERWVLTMPDKADSLPQVFLSEEKAMSVANGIAHNQQTNVEVAHERQDDNGNWLEVTE